MSEPHRDPPADASRGGFQTRPYLLALLRQGAIETEGLVPWSSNYTFLVKVRAGETEALAIYKPCRGERPLHDFAAGTLCRREVAAYLVSEALGWPAIPPVVLRLGPHGLGSVQVYIDADLDAHFFALRDAGGHATFLRRVALYDAVVNNADRKGGHILRGPDGRLWAIDHGLTFHTEHKLRTVIWDYAGQPIPQGWRDQLAALRDALALEGAPLRQALLDLLTLEELAATARRIDRLLRRGAFPLPLRDWHNVPYPLV
ncbi:MAG: SCO1664 family protein [Chloroflexota bacterium]